MDEETGLYYYGARYLDPKYSMWISTDPALGEYIPKAPIDEEAKRYNQNLPGMGGVFNHINGNLYHYAANNPLRYIDPTGRDAKSFVIGWITTDASTPDPSDASIWKWIGYGVAFLSACVIDEYKDKAIVYVASQLLENSEEPKNYVYHHTGAHNTEFAKKLKKLPSSVIDFARTDKDSRFGQCFYVVSDPLTASLEASDPGIVIKIEISPNAKILDLTNAEIAKQYGYSEGMSRDDARYLMKSWNLTYIDAIKYSSEKNPGGYNYAVLNTAILKPAE